MDKLKTLVRIEKLIEREKENSRIYCELNPADARNRKQREQLVIGAYIQCMYEIAD
jgi:hypothetical protein